jgi:Kef-type K+ transport system membrane component KefB
VIAVLAFVKPEGPVLEFLVLFAVILLGPIIFSRFGLPGLIGLVIGGFVVGSHGLGLIHAGNQTVPELGKLGLLYLMFVAGLELDLQVMREYQRGAVIFGLIAFIIPAAGGVSVGLLLGWETPATILVGALLASHTLIVYPNLRDAGLSGNPAVAVAVGATVLTDTIALVVLALVAGTQTGSGSIPVIVGEIALGLLVLIAVGLFALPRVVDAAFRRWGSDRVARYVVIIVALLFMATLAQVFDIEGIVGAFFAGIALNRLVPNEGPSMERVEFFGAAVFIPIFLVSIGLLLDPHVMFTGHTLGLAALLIAAALGGKAIACALAGPIMHFDWPQRLAMYVLTIPQAAATLAVSLVGFEIGVFGVSVVNAVLVLILVSILVAALIAQKVIKIVPADIGRKVPLGSKVLVVTGAGGPSDAAVRVATLLARPDGGHSDLLITRPAGDSKPALAMMRALEKRIFRHGFDGHIRTGVATSLGEAVQQAVISDTPSLVIVDDPSFDASPASVPLLVLDGLKTGPDAVRLILDGDERVEIAQEVARRLAKGESRAALFGRRPDRPTGVPV